jgi:hypothetical protein
MKKHSIKFQFIKEKGQWPILIAKTKCCTFICLECHPTESGYFKHCIAFLDGCLNDSGIPTVWQEVEDKTYTGRVVDVKQGREKLKDVPLNKLPF